MLLEWVCGKARVKPGRQDGNEGCQVIDGVLLAHTVVGPMTKGQEVLLEGHVIIGKAVRVELVGVRVALHIAPTQ